MDVRGVSEGGASISVPPRGPFPPARSTRRRPSAPRRALHATLRVKHFAGFVDGREGGGRRGGRAQGEGGGDAKEERARGRRGRREGGRREGARGVGKRGLGGKTTVFPLIERLARGAEESARRGGV